MFPPIAPDWFESIPGSRKLWRLNHGLGRCVEAVFDWKWDPTSIEWKLHLFHFAWLVPHLNHFLYMPACQKRPETLKNGCCWLLLAQNAKFQPNLGFLGAESQKNSTMLVSTGSFKKNGKSKTVFMGTKFHEKLIFSAFFSRELATNLRSWATRSVTITLWHPENVAPPVWFQALVGWLRLTTASTP